MNSKYRILHIANWFPDAQEPKRALWIRDQIDLTKRFADTEVWHVEVVNGRRPELNCIPGKEATHLILTVPVKNWFLIEWLSFMLLGYLLIFKVNLSRYSHLHFHIAYPLLTYWHLIQKIVNIPVVLTEHWSAYHFKFNITKPKKLKRIQRIFFNNLHLITVSDALKNDIISFSNHPNLRCSVVPNVIDFQSFKFQPVPIKKDTFFMVSQWKDPKDPFTVLEVIKRLEGINLRIGGYGPQMEAIESTIKKNQLEDKVELLGQLDKDQIAKEMQSAAAFIQCSKYETFSVVCVEALACGCPVIASAVGGIPEYLTSKNGVLVDNNSVDEWYEAMNGFENESFSREQISKDVIDRYDTTKTTDKLRAVYE